MLVGVYTIILPVEVRRLLVLVVHSAIANKSIQCLNISKAVWTQDRPHQIKPAPSDFDFDQSSMPCLCRAASSAVATVPILVLLLLPCSIATERECPSQDEALGTRVPLDSRERVRVTFVNK